MRLALTIGNLNHQNINAVYEIVGSAGYAGSMKLVDECTRILDIGDSFTRASFGITEHEVKTMIGELIMYTSATVQSQPY